MRSPIWTPDCLRMQVTARTSKRNHVWKTHLRTAMCLVCAELPLPIFLYQFKKRGLAVGVGDRAYRHAGFLIVHGDFQLGTAFGSRTSACCLRNQFANGPGWGAFLRVICLWNAWIWPLHSTEAIDRGTRHCARSVKETSPEQTCAGTRCAASRWDICDSLACIR